MSDHEPLLMWPPRQAAFRRKMGRVYRRLLRSAMDVMGACLQQVKAAEVIGSEQVAMMEGAIQQYHDILGRFGSIFAEYEPPGAPPSPALPCKRTLCCS